MVGFGIHNLFAMKTKEDEIKLHNNIREMICTDIEKGLSCNKDMIEELIEYSKAKNELVEFRLDTGLTLYNAFLLGRGEIIVPNLEDVKHIIDNGSIQRVEMTNAIFSVDKNNKVIGEITFMIGGSND